GEDFGSAFMTVDSNENLKPVYEELPGWSESTVGARSLAELPENARAYIRFIEQQIEAPVDIISTGPDRDETIILRHPFSD
ncbi:MAG: adenylosuccinate synthetase, partial [Pseudohongiella sp.]|nr:adenylosuccinate synthetase [Pseudohongiella sp.]